ncbi:MAG: S-layer homology domain-containing protein [Oscillospiraceae bacterium]|nr:S-layer homology domain-containing protein [Oscillospiraceae bacterium]
MIAVTVALGVFAGGAAGAAGGGAAMSGYWIDFRSAGYAPGARDEGSRTLTLYSAAELGLLIYELIEIDENMYEGWTVALGADIDLTAHCWTPINLRGVVFDGGGHNIIGLELDSVNHFPLTNYTFYDDGEAKWICTGMFGAIIGSAVQNFTLVDQYIFLRRTGYDVCAGVVAGLAIGARIRNVAIENPTVLVEVSSSTTDYIGGVVGYAKPGPFLVETPVGGQSSMTIIRDVEVHGGEIVLERAYGIYGDFTNWVGIPRTGIGGSMVYMGGVAGANYESTIHNAAVYETLIRAGAHYYSSEFERFCVGGIAGYTSMTDGAALGTCVLNSMAVGVTIDIDPDITIAAASGDDDVYVGGLCGIVYNDSVVNNLYIGSGGGNGGGGGGGQGGGSGGMFGMVDNTAGYVVDYNYAFASIAEAWGSNGGGGALYSDVLSGASPGDGGGADAGGMWRAAQVTVEHMPSYSIGDALAKYKLWGVFDAGNEYGYAAHTPRFGNYYTEPTDIVEEPEDEEDTSDGGDGGDDGDGDGDGDGGDGSGSSGGSGGSGSGGGGNVSGGGGAGTPGGAAQLAPSASPTASPSPPPAPIPSPSPAATAARTSQIHDTPQGAPFGAYSSIENPFSDVAQSDWFIEAVMFAYSRGLMLGTSEDPMLFSPNAALTRGMAVTVLYRMEGSPAASVFRAAPAVPAAPAFSDIADGAWYADAVAWAANEGIVAGYLDATFRPDNNITREDIVTILGNYATYKGFELRSVREFTAFGDIGVISGYALEAVERFYCAGIVNGKLANFFDPQGEATRAEYAAMLMRIVGIMG